MGSDEDLITLDYLTVAGRTVAGRTAAGRTAAGSSAAGEGGGEATIAILSNNRPEKHNAANDAMDAQLFERLRELSESRDVRAIVWRGNGKSFSSGRDTSELGVRTEDIRPSISLCCSVCRSALRSSSARTMPLTTL